MIVDLLPTYSYNLHGRELSRTAEAAWLCSVLVLDRVFTLVYELVFEDYISYPATPEQFFFIYVFPFLSSLATSPAASPAVEE